MAIIDKMELFNEPDRPSKRSAGEHPMFITVFRRYFTFSTAATLALKEPEYLHMYVDRKNKKIAFKPCPQDDAAITFCVKTPTGNRRANIFSQSKVELLRELSGMEDSEGSRGVRFPAEYIDKEQTLLVDLAKPIVRPESASSIPLTVPEAPPVTDTAKPGHKDTKSSGT